MLTKFISCALFVLMTGSALAQGYYASPFPYVNMNLGLEADKEVGILKSAKVQFVEIQLENHKKNRTHKSNFERYHLDANGEVVRYVWRNKHGALIRDINLRRDSNGLIQHAFGMDKKGDTTFSTHAYYDGEKRIILDIKTDSKARIAVQRNYTYDSSRLVRLEILHGQKLYKLWQFDYYPNGDRKETVMSNGKLKVKGVWNYACNDDGIVLGKHKDTATVCVEKSQDYYGNNKMVYHTTNPDGSVHKSIVITNSIGKLLSSYYYKGLDEQLSAEWHYSYLSDSIKLYQSYKRYQKGKLTHANLTEYNPQGLTTKSQYQTYRRGRVKLHVQQEYVFDDNFLPVSMSGVNDSGLRFSRRISYVKYP